LLFNFALEFAVKKVQENQVWLNERRRIKFCLMLIWTHRELNIDTLKENRQNLIDDSMEVRSRKLKLTTVGSTALTTRHPSIRKSWH
jgi:hypothetical protein